MLGEKGRLERPLVGPHYQVWKSPKSRVLAYAKNTWEAGFRLGPQGSGASTK